MTMGNSFGTLFRFTIFGQSHAPAIGVTIEGLPAGFGVSEMRGRDRKSVGEGKRVH